MEGFDRALVDAIRPYATVYPYSLAILDGIGINPNTAPSHVLATPLPRNRPGLAASQTRTTSGWILDTRDEDKVFCPQSGGYGELDCEFLSDETGAGLAGIYPQPKYTRECLPGDCRGQLRRRAAHHRGRHRSKRSQPAR